MDLDEQIGLLLGRTRNELSSREECPGTYGAYAKLRHALRTVRDGGSATFIPGGPVQLELQLEEELPINVFRRDRKNLNQK